MLPPCCRVPAPERPQRFEWSPTLKRSTIFLTLMCLLALPMFSAPMFAQPQSATSQAGWEIVRADYGSGNTWVDVTERVRALIHNDLLSFRVGPTTVGQAGQRGNNHILKMQLRDARGNTRQISFRDRQRVNFKANNSSMTQLRITKAIYGTRYRTADVTARLNSQIQGNQINLRVNNDTMGGDPAPNRSKQLTVQYVLAGRAAETVINEGETLSLNNSNANNGRLKITRAVYGVGSRWSDVTNRLTSRI